jgi:hypothetical protein
LTTASSQITPHGMHLRQTQVDEAMGQVVLVGHKQSALVPNPQERDRKQILNRYREHAERSKPIGGQASTFLISSYEHRETGRRIDLG